MSNFKILKREIETDLGTEIVIEKRYNLFKDQEKNRLWVMQPQDPQFLKLQEKMQQAGLW